MLSLFPSLLGYQFFAITLIRIAAGFTLLYVSYRFAFERDEIARTQWPLVGRIPQWLTLFGALVVFAAAVFLLIGLFTQAAAIVGIMIALKDVVFARRYPRTMPLSTAAAALLFVICFSLLFFGAGAFGFDLPL